MPQTLAIVALIAAVGASVMLLFLPLYQGEAFDPATNVGKAITFTLVEVNGWDVLVPLSIPPGLAAVGWLAVVRAKHYRQLFVWIAAFLLAVFVFITGFSIGLFYVPAMIMSMTGAMVAQLRGSNKVQ